ncbi:hypothetical protein LY76DRAFT_610849 [Colletotrichum caudatum]|nr:hypothetical protein LY76DRAFT_610849 [Colletotrichum caudatum]
MRPCFLDYATSLAQLALVSHTWHDIANPLLYKHAILWDWYMLCPGREWMQLPDNRVGVLMTAALSGDLVLLSRLAGYVPHALRPLDTAQVLSAAFHVPGLCPIHDDDDDGCEDRRPFATLLHVAAMRGDQDMTHWLLRRRVSIEASAQLGCLCPSPYMDAIRVTGVWHGWGIEPTPLHLSLAHGNESTAKLLIRKGAVWDRPHSSCGGLTGLHMMAAGRMTEMIEWTIDQCHGPWAGAVARNGPVHDWPDEFGYWSLHYACLSEGPKEEGDSWAAQMVSGLIRLGALVHTTDGSQIAQLTSCLQGHQRASKCLRLLYLTLPLPHFTMADNGNGNGNGNRSGANQGRLNFTDAYPYNAAPSSNVVSTLINNVFAPAAAARPQAASRAMASLYASVQGHGRHLHAQLRENPDVAAKDTRAERANATLQDRWGPHPWVPVAYAPRPSLGVLWRNPATYASFLTESRQFWRDRGPNPPPLPPTWLNTHASLGMDRDTHTWLWWNLMYSAFRISNVMSAMYRYMTLCRRRYLVKTVMMGIL